MTVTTVPPGLGHRIVCRFTSVLDFARVRAELPLNGLQFSKALNAVGPWQGSFKVEDPRVREAFWQEATAPNRTAMWVDIDGRLLYGGITTARNYQLATGVVTVSGGDFCGYLSQRLQAGEYNFASASAMSIATAVLRDALARAYSIPVGVTTTGPEAGEAYKIAFAAPEAQMQTLSAVLSQLTELGFMTGIDYACDVAYAAGVPTATITSSYPRRGGGKALVIDLSGALDLEYDEDGSQQADQIVEQAGALVERSSSGIWTPARDAGYPLLEAQISHPSLAPTEGGQAILEAFLAGSLAVRAYPLTAPVVTLPMFGTPSVFDLEVGDDVILYVPVTAGAQPSTNPLFPKGLEARFRIVRIDCEVPDEGVPVMKLTLNLPPMLVPVQPPELNREAKEKQEKEATEAREKEKTEKAEKEKEAQEKLEQEAKEALEKETAEAEKLAEEAETIAKEALEKATTERAKKEAEEALKRAEAVLKKAKAKHTKSKGKHNKREVEKERAEVERETREAEETKLKSEIVSLPIGGEDEDKKIEEELAELRKAICGTEAEREEYCTKAKLPYKYKLYLVFECPEKDEVSGGTWEVTLPDNEAKSSEKEPLGGGGTFSPSFMHLFGGGEIKEGAGHFPKATKCKVTHVSGNNWPVSVSGLTLMFSEIAIKLFAGLSPAGEYEITMEH